MTRSRLGTVGSNGRLRERCLENRMRKLGFYQNNRRTELFEEGDELSNENRERTRFLLVCLHDVL